MSNSRRPRSPQLDTSGSGSRATPVVVALVVLVCIGAIVAISLALQGGNESAAPPTPSATSLAGGPPCVEPPPAPTPTTYSTPPPAAAAHDAIWRATISTTCGDIGVELAGDKAPQAVASFVFLARQHFYDDGPCSRLTTAASGIFVLQCGDPTGTGGGGPGYEFSVENAPSDGNYPAGTLAMARGDDPNSNGSQFFIVYKKTSLPTSGGGYTIFGTVTSGLDVIQALGRQGVAGGGPDGPPAQPVSVLDVFVQEK